jgi:hypothetical protein
MTINLMLAWRAATAAAWTEPQVPAVATLSTAVSTSAVTPGLIAPTAITRPTDNVQTSQTPVPALATTITPTTPTTTPTIGWQPGPARSVSNTNLADYRTLDIIPVLDVWGEGRIDYSVGEWKQISGFSDAYNLNLKTGLREQEISDGPNKGSVIPGLVPVADYENPAFPLPDNSVLVMTLMNAPISRGTAREMVRVLKKPEGRIILYDPDPASLRNFETEAERSEEKLAVQRDEALPPPFDHVTFEEFYIYGWADRGSRQSSVPAPARTRPIQFNGGFLLRHRPGPGLVTIAAKSSCGSRSRPSQGHHS